MMDDVNPTVAADESLASASASVPWSPRQFAFRPYDPIINPAAKTRNLRVIVKRPLVSRLTKDIVKTYRICNPQFNYSEELNPKQFLTTPSAGVLNDGYDNENSDLILSINCPIVNSETNRRYIVKEMLGQGTFGQVAKCWVAELDRFVAVKIIKNQPAYYRQALVEVSILKTLNNKLDPEDKHHIVRIYEFFTYQRHLCIAFELLDTNLYDLLKLNKYCGLSLRFVQLFSKQILYGLALMKDAAIIHCDLKPENILLCTRMKPPGVKIIDFGSACMEDHTVYSYIQSRYYRSPEVVLGYQYTTAIDMWSFGCIVAELFLGLPLFPGASEFDLLKRMMQIIGDQPPDYVLKGAKNTRRFFKCVVSVNHEDGSQASSYGRSNYQALNEEEYEAREMKKPLIGKEFFNHMNLEGIVKKYPYRKDLEKEDLARESQMRLALIDFLKGLVEFDPAKRWSPLQASKHPFVTGEPFTCPYMPAPETPRVPVSHNVKVDHHPAGGHWFAAGLSPNVLGGNRVAMSNNSHFQVLPHAYGGNFGSLGGHGSYNDGTGLGSSYGSYGDNGNMLPYYSPVGPSPLNNYAQNILVLGSSPDARQRIMQIPHGNGFGFSPAGNFAPMSLGASPSQFTPPFSQMTAESPGQYGSSSPVRGNCHGSPLGKGTMPGNQMNRRKGLGYSGNLPTQESTSSAQWQGQFSDVNSLNLNAGNRKQQQRNSGNTGAHSSFGSGKPFMHAKGAVHEKSEASSSLPEPGDWDPNYSDELLLQDNSSELNNMTMEFRKSVKISQAFSPAEPFAGVGRFNQMSNSNTSTQSVTILHSMDCHLHIMSARSPITCSSRKWKYVAYNGKKHVLLYTMTKRPNGSIQAIPHVESSPDVYVHPMMNSSHLMPHFSQFSPSRLGQQPVQRFSHGRSMGAGGGEWNHVMGQAPLANFSSGGPHSPRSNNSAPWGRRGNHPMAEMNMEESSDGCKI